MSKITNRRKIKHYSDFQFYYGLYSLLIALEYFEANEDYNECLCIVKGIESNEKLMNTKYAKKLKYSGFEGLSNDRKICQEINSEKLINYVF